MTGMTRPAGVEVTQLLRTSDPGVEGAIAVRRLVRAVAEWSPGAALDITFGTHERHRVLLFAQYGDPQPGWDGDVAWALERIAVVGPTRQDMPNGDAPDWASVVELQPTRVARPLLSPFSRPSPTLEPDDSPPAPEQELLRRRLGARLRTPWPEPQFGNLQETAELLAERPDLLIRFRLSSAVENEMDMLADSMLETWTGSDDELYAYLGQPIRLRAMLASRAGTVPARMRALARRWARGLSVVPLDPAQAPDAWDGDVRSLYGHAVPEGVGLSLLRLPAAGQEPFPGMSTEHPKSQLRPLDPVPPIPEHPVRLGSAVTVTGDPVDATLDVSDLIRHTFIEGQSGSGKSTMIATLVRELTRLGYGCTFLDPHGTTIGMILQELPENSDSTYVIRHSDAESPIPLDVMTGSMAETEITIDNFAEMIQEMYDPSHTGIVGPRWRRWFGLIAKATQTVLGEAASLVAVTEIGSDPQLIKLLAAATGPRDPALANALLAEIVNNKSTEAAEVQAWCVSKLHPLISNQQMRAILGTGYDAVNVTEFMDTGQTLLVDLASPALGPQSSRLLGALWLLKHQQAMGRRGTDRPHIIIVDEAHLFQYGSLPRLLSEGRKFGIGVVVATQYLGQLRDDLAESLEANAGSFLTFSTGLSYAVRSSIRLAGWPVEELVRLPSLRAATSLSLNGTKTDPFTLIVDHHQRMDEQGARGPLAASRAAFVERSSRARLSDPHREAPVYDASRIARALKESANRPKGSDSQSPGRGEGPSGSNFLDDWLAKRKMLLEQPTHPSSAPTPADVFDSAFAPPEDASHGSDG